ncbi:CHAT domain-containing protein [Streptomyces sp. NPDC048332]|uniref:CHAT domain-containing protein n=1 Tax=Streptomyces sp. NPDC048332 TaxID=3154619 RepID=UPI00343E7204
MSEAGFPADERMALARAWDGLVDAVRAAGYDDFLRPPPLDALFPAAVGGPVVIVNLGKLRGDALVVRPAGVTHRHLPGLTESAAQEQTLGYLRVLEDVDRAVLEVFRARARYDDGDRSPLVIRQYTQAKALLQRATRQRDATFTDVLRWLWRTVAEPVLDELGLASPPPAGEPWPRVWWCPTGPLALLPLHAAGHHDERGRAEGLSVLDRVVSSYTPTLRALVDARRPAAQAGPDERLLIVAVPEAPGQEQLAGASGESALLCALFPFAHTLLQAADATVPAVRTAMARHRWAHFACHGDQNLADPSHGGLLLSDGVLTIADIGAGRHDGDFAFLSACKTAMGGVLLPDEAITLTAAMHLTGYRHVIGTLWSVHDRTAATIAASVYARLTAAGTFDPAGSALALHEAVHRLRDTERLPPAAWLPFTHTGP